MSHTFILQHNIIEPPQVIDQRSVHLGGSSRWIRNNLEVFKHKSVLTAHDWFLLVQSAGDYLLYDLFPGDVQKVACLMGLKEACNLCLSANSAFDSENREAIDKVKKTVIEALCVAEAMFPKTELAVMFHVLMHIPDGIYRWNNVRNFWSFFGERFIIVVVSTQILIVFCIGAWIG
jgi:hypothetical protein